MYMCWHKNVEVNVKAAISQIQLVIIRLDNYYKDALHTLLFLTLLESPPLFMV